jgi:Family of unknown function (DUF6515)
MNAVRTLRGVAGLWVAGLLAASAAHAQGQGQEHPPQGQPHAQGQVHAQPPIPHSSQPTIHGNPSHYYPPRGTAVNVPPPAPVVINHPNGRYYYSGGVWYAPRGPSYVVVAAPVGVFVPVLPVYYTTVWVGGAPYYYANDTYYSWSPGQNSYEVVSPPGDDGIPPPEDPDAAAPPPAPAGDGLFVYPQHGQNDQQQATDRYECHKWAGLQSGFDPTQPGGGASAQQPGGNPDDYQRAMKACLEGRGYSVR